MIFLSKLKKFFYQKEIEFISRFDSYKKALDEIKGEKIISIDTEFDWRDTYFPNLSLIQIGISSKVYIIDFLNLENINELKEILNNPISIKIFHSLRGDISVMSLSNQIRVENVVDTQIAEDFLTESKNTQIAYKDLVKKYLNVNIDKTETNSNWLKRPLSKNQISYAADDVLFLEKILLKQIKLLKRKNLYDAFIEKCKKEKALAETDFTTLRLRRFLKKNKNISNIEKKIFIWREEKAKLQNVPPNKIFKERNFKLLKKILLEKKFNECQWIIPDSEDRKSFLSEFK